MLRRTGIYPGLLETGKTVLQHAISKQAEANIVIMAACGERANEVVEIFMEFPKLEDPHTGRKLMERTIIIANTSNMPVASREASVYTAMTIAEYYRSMGLRVLLMADSTSRWAQALREMSNRMEELPGQDAFPMDLSAIIGTFYSRAGYVYSNNGSTGSITFIGTVSPAGGNLKEPVTEGTKKAARCFYALEQSRADRKRYPAVNPIESYSKYIEYPEFEDYINTKVEGNWIKKVNEMKTLLQRGKEVQEQINILGDDGVPVNYHETFWKSEVIDFVILQQDAFDKVDAVCPLERQEFMLNLVMDICKHDYDFDNFLNVMDYFKKIINICKQMNYSEFHSKQFEKYLKELKTVLAENSKQKCMATKAFQKIYTKITAITKATCSLKADGIGNDELVTIDGKLAQVVKIMGNDITLQVFEGTEGIPTNAEVIFLGKTPSLKVSDQLAGRFFNAFGSPIEAVPK